MAAFAVMGALPASSQKVCEGDHRNPPLRNLGSGEYCVKGGSSNSKGCDGYLATGNFDQVKSVVNSSGACGLSYWSFDGDAKETPRPTFTLESTETPIPPTDTPHPDPTDTPKPDPSVTPKPEPTNTSKPPPMPTDQEPKASATFPPSTVTLTVSPQSMTLATETPLASETPYVCVICGCPCGSQTPIVVEVIAEAPDLSPIAEELKPIFYVLVGIFAMLGGSLILGGYNTIKK